MTVSFRLRLPGPLDLATSLDGFRRSGDDLVDRWDGRRLLRTVRVDGVAVPFGATVAGTLDRPALDVTVRREAHREPVAEALGTMFVFGPPPPPELDPVVAGLDRLYPGLRPVLHPDLLTALVRSISAQQVNLAWAATTRGRLALAYGRRHRLDGEEVWSFEAERLAGADPAELRALQFTTRKSEYIVGAARLVAEGALSYAELAAVDDEEVIRRIVAIRGLGRWSAEWLLCRTLGRPRVVAGDLGVRKAVGMAYLGGRMPSEDEVRRATDHFGPLASVAQQLLLHGLAEGSLPAIAQGRAHGAEDQ